MGHEGGINQEARRKQDAHRRTGNEALRVAREKRAEAVKLEIEIKVQ